MSKTNLQAASVRTPKAYDRYLGPDFASCGRGKVLVPAGARVDVFELPVCWLLGFSVEGLGV